MSKKTKQLAEQAYYPEVIPDTFTDNIERIKVANDLRQSKFEKARREYYLEIQRRILGDKNDRELHVIETIIKWTEAGKRTIHYRLFNFYLEEWPLFKVV